MKIVSYNIQYGVGLDGRYDIARIVDVVRDADVILLQEVSRNNPSNEGRDMVGEIAAALPDRFHVFGSNFDANVASHIDKQGRAHTVMFQLGNMILSRSPIHLSRNLLLPRQRSFDHMNFQRGALEALIETPLGVIRFYSTHLDHRSPRERQAQVRFLKERVLGYPLEGGGLSGLSERGFPEPPALEAFVVAGDFNMLAGSPEYRELCGEPDHEFGLPLTADLFVDSAARPGIAGDDLTTWVDPARPDDASRWKRIDYAFTSASLAKNIKSYAVDREAVGSDHLPIWL
ncbi:EEP domain-containing protein, partial [Escherichia coli]|nr:EEP domain-containing protein [Escherichia coli]